jgi:hypothetical protein
LNDGVAHPVGVTASSCVLCHPGTVHEDGYTIVDPAEGASAHKNGQVDYVLGWQTPTCVGCHGAPPNAGEGDLHRLHWNSMVAGGRDTCATCHRGFEVGDDSPGARAVEASVHMNGQAEVVLQDGTPIDAANLPDGSWSLSSCLPCHDALGVND